MLVAQAEPPQQEGRGDYYYRTFAPGMAMAQEDGVYVVNLSNVHRRKDEIFKSADVLVLKNICDSDLLPLIRERKRNGQLTVYEIADDLNAVHPWNPVYFFYKNRENLDLVFRLASFCDAVQFSVPRLRKLYGHFNNHCEVFPNQMLHIPAERPLRKSAEIVIGWGGSHGHLEDMAEIVVPLSNWIITQPNATLHLMCSDPIWQLFDRVPEDMKRRTLPGSMDDYYNFLAQIDIGIAPLKNTPFNRSRSDVKFLEYAVSGVVPVTVRLEPYLRSVKDGVTGFIYDDPDHLIAILNRVLENPYMLSTISRTAREYVIRERHQMDHGRNRIEFYSELMQELGKERAEGIPSIQFMEDWSKIEGAVISGRHLRLMDTTYEKLLHDGLITMQVAGDKEKARKLFEDAMDVEPQDYLSFLFASPVWPNPVESLLKALELKPDSVKSWVMLGEEFTRQGKIGEALESFASATRVFPDYDIPYSRAAELLKRIGEQSQARMLLEKAKTLSMHCLPPSEATK